MKLTLVVFIILMDVFLVSAQEKRNFNPLVIGEIRTIKSSILNEERTLNIYLPLQYDSSKVYPVIYLLDGSINEDFLHIVGLVQFFNMSFQMPDFIIVGIGNVDRKRDFTFHTELIDLKTDYPTTGHSAKFIEFIEKELQVYVQNQYKVNDVKYIIGQSLGGLLATEILLKMPELFSHYFIVSPSLWWDNESLLKNAVKLLKDHSDIKAYVYMSAGEFEDIRMRHGTEEIYEYLKSSGMKNLKVDFQLMRDENHATILHNSIYKGFQKLFPYKE
jgi:predicted alpha/beta superfamily hydrolase